MVSNKMNYPEKDVDKCPVYSKGRLGKTNLLGKLHHKVYYQSNFNCFYNCGEPIITISSFDEHLKNKCN